MSVERVMVNGHELTAFDLPPEPSETYTVNVDGLGEIVVERGKPPREKDMPAMYMRKLVPELCEQNAALFRENAKLRELVLDMWRFTGEACKKYPRLFDAPAQGPQMVQLNAIEAFEQRMRELGIEVDE